MTKENLWHVASGDKCLPAAPLQALGPAKQVVPGTAPFLLHDSRHQLHPAKGSQIVVPPDAQAHRSRERPRCWTAGTGETVPPGKENDGGNSTGL